MSGNRLRRAVAGLALLACALTQAGAASAEPADPATVLKLCPTGAACVEFGNQQIVFRSYGRYAVHWTGYGLLENASLTGSVRLLSLQTQLICIPPGRTVRVDWTPIWWLEFTAQPCSPN